MESFNGFSLAIRSVQGPSSSTSDSGKSQPSDGRPGANNSRFPEERTKTANSIALNSSSFNSNAPIFSDDVGDNVRQKNISRLPLATWSASPATSNSRELDFDSVQSAVFHESDNESAVRCLRQSYVKPEDRCGRFKWSDNVTSVRRPMQKLGVGNGDNAVNPPSDWAAAKKLERLAVKELKKIKKQNVVNAYTGGLNQTQSTPIKVGQRTSSYINRKAKERETARINSIMMKKILNAKSTIFTQR